MKSEDIVRARFLMSPYNLREARRTKELRNSVIGIVLTVVVLLIATGIYALWQR